MFGLATDNNVDLYGISGTNVLDIDTNTGTGTPLVNYAGTNLGGAWGSAFLTEAGGGPDNSIPEPAGLGFAALGLVGLPLSRWRVHPV